MDNETQQVLGRQDRLKLIIEHDSWPLVKESVMNKIVELQSIADIDFDASPESLALELKSRKLAASILYNWIAEIEGDARMGDIVHEEEVEYMVRISNKP